MTSQTIRRDLAAIQAAQRRRRTVRAVWQLVWSWRWAIVLSIPLWIVIGTALMFIAKELVMPML